MFEAVKVALRKDIDEIAKTIKMLEDQLPELKGTKMHDQVQRRVTLAYSQLARAMVCERIMAGEMFLVYRGQQKELIVAEPSHGTSFLIEAAEKWGAKLIVDSLDQAPLYPCPSCHSEEWYLNKNSGRWLCPTCHPKPPATEAENGNVKEPATAGA